LNAWEVTRNGINVSSLRPNADKPLNHPFRTNSYRKQLPDGRSPCPCLAQCITDGERQTEAALLQVLGGHRDSRFRWDTLAGIAGCCLGRPPTKRPDYASTCPNLFELRGKARAFTMSRSICQAVADDSGPFAPVVRGLFLVVTSYLGRSFENASNTSRYLAGSQRSFCPAQSRPARVRQNQKHSTRWARRHRYTPFLIVIRECSTHASAQGTNASDVLLACSDFVFSLANNAIISVSGAR